jgi:uncharacterized protein (DUF433 family)
MTMESKAVQLGRITIDPAICNGRPVVRGMRITVETVLGHLAEGDTAEEILNQYPVLEPDDIRACLAFASEMLSRKFEVLQPV